MRHPDPKRITELTEKLKTQGDITEQEADSVRSLFLKKFAEIKLNSESPKFDRELFDALVKFAETALNLVKQEQPGIFISSFPAVLSDPSYYADPGICKIINKIRDNLLPKDRAAIFNVSFDQYEEKHADSVNTDILKNTKREKWIFLDYVGYFPSNSFFSPSCSFWGYRPDCLGFFRRRSINKIFGNYANILAVSDPFIYSTAEFFFNHAGYNIINTSDILSCAVIQLINSKNIPFVVYGDICDKGPNPEKYEYDNYIAVEAGLARRITETVGKNKKHIIVEMREKGIIRPLKAKDDDDVYSKTSGIERSPGAERLIRRVTETPDVRDWFEFDDFNKMTDFARDLLCEALKYGKTIDRAREESAEEDIWIMK
jgi:hypothetical protein